MYIYIYIYLESESVKYENFKVVHKNEILQMNYPKNAGILNKN